MGGRLQYVRVFLQAFGMGFRISIFGHPETLNGCRARGFLTHDAAPLLAESPV